MTEQPLTSGTNLRSFLLLEKLDVDYLGEIWKAQHSRSREMVSARILHPELTADQESRTAFLAEATAACKLDHPLIARVLEAIEIDNLTLIASQPISGQHLNEVIGATPLSSAAMIRFGTGIAEALAYAHEHEVIHGCLRPGFVFAGDEGALRIGGFGTGRRSALLPQARQSLGEAEDAFYLSPEVIAGADLDLRTDVFSLGVLLYQMATGHVPFNAATADEVCDKILSQSPPNPKLHNPDLDVGRIRIIGKCLQKDPAKRYQSLRVLIQDLQGLSQKKPEMMTMSGLASFKDDLTHPPPRAAQEIAKATPAVSAPLSPNEIAQTDITLLGNEAPVVASGGVILFASLPEQSQGDGKLAGVMQQVLGEAAYMFDGRIVDPFGLKMVAQFSDPVRAVNAARKGRDELLAYNRRQRDVGMNVPARMVLHGGEVTLVRGAAAGPAVEAADRASQKIQPLIIAASPGVLDQVHLVPAGDPMTSVDGVPFYALPAHPVIPLDFPPAAAEAPASPPQTPAEKKKRVALISVVAAAILLMLGSIAWYVSKLDRHIDADEVRAAASTPAPVSTPNPILPLREVVIDAFVVDPGNPALQTVADRIRFGSIGLLGTARELIVHASGSAAGTERFGARILAPVPAVVAGAAGTVAVNSQPPGSPPPSTTSTAVPPATNTATGYQLVPIRFRNNRPVEGQPFPFETSEDAAANLTRWIRQQLQLQTPPPPVTSASVFDEFADAIGARESATDLTRAVSAIRQAVKTDPEYLPAQLAAVDLFAAAGDRKAAMDSATKVVALDPENVDVRRKLAGWKVQSGSPTEALTLFRSVLADRPDDTEALQAVALYSLAVDDEPRFTKTLSRLQPLLREPPKFHAPDLLLATGQIDKAATPLFELETEQPQNPALALKIGRVAVLRRMMTIADLELKKLATLDPTFSQPLLQAYVLAQNGDRAGAESQLRKAQATATWKNLPYTYGAEVYALLGNQKGVIDSLEAAVSRAEPSGSYILNNPLFRYLDNDGHFRKIKASILAQQLEIKNQLATFPH